MRGEIEVWRGDELLLSEPNMIVDGAGELLADIMTISPSLSSIQNTATSAILDASNYRIQAISFGTGKEAYNQGAHKMDATKASLYQSNAFYGWNRVNISGIVPLVSIPSSTEYYLQQPISYQPTGLLPVTPDPTLTVLEPDIEMNAKVGGIFVSSVFPPNGQLTNFLPSAIASAMMANTVFSSTTSGLAAAALLGCFPDGSGAIPTDSRYSRVYIRTNRDDSTTNIQAAGYTTIGGVFNAASSMDVSGYVNMIMSSVPRVGYSMSSTSSGLCLSADSNFSSNGIVEYSVLLASGDLGYATMYGGIYHLGLWTIDMQKCLQNGNTPPFAFRQLNNPRKYKLFCRKGLSKSLTYTDNEITLNDLLIKWRLKFL